MEKLILKTLKDDYESFLVANEMTTKRSSSVIISIPHLQIRTEFNCGGKVLFYLQKIENCET